MKKILSLALILSMCMGLSMSSFAQSGGIKMYLANSRLEVEDTEPYVEDDDAPTEGNGAADNTNLNPGTGR